MDHSGLSYGNFCEKNKHFAPLQSNLVILPIFFTKMAITQPRMIQIPKFWCLKSCTNIWLHFGNIHSIQKINRIELEGKKGSKFAKIGQFFTLQKIKIEFSQKFPKVWFHGFFLWLTNILEKLISLTDLMGRVKCLGQSCRAQWAASERSLLPPPPLLGMDKFWNDVPLLSYSFIPFNV